MHYHIGRICWLTTLDKNTLPCASKNFVFRADNYYRVADARREGNGLTEGTGDAPVAIERVGPRLQRRVGPHGAPRRLHHAAVGLAVAPSEYRGSSVRTNAEREEKEGGRRAHLLRGHCQRLSLIGFFALMLFCSAALSLMVIPSIALENGFPWMEPRYSSPFRA